MEKEKEIDKMFFSNKARSFEAFHSPFLVSSTRKKREKKEKIYSRDKCVLSDQTVALPLVRDCRSALGTPERNNSQL